VVERDGRRIPLEATIGRSPDRPGIGLLGVTSDYPDVTVGLLPAAGHAARETVTGIGSAVTGIGRFFTSGVGDFARQVLDAGNGDEAREPAGGGGAGGRPSPGREPDENRVISIYGAARLLEDMSGDGFASFFLLLAMLNLFIGVFNLVPLLPLDGGHVAIAVYERLRSRRGTRYVADISKLMPVAYVAVTFLVLLGLSSLYLDIVDPVGIG
jgi:membrane-associated protease RseP (regulator of RpoE activity)